MKTLKYSDLIGKEFISRKSFPFIARGTKKKDDDEFSYYIITGEKVKIDSYNENEQLFTLINLSLENSMAEIKISKEELDKLRRV